jgi:hypothetical protein
VITYRAMLDVSRELVSSVARLLRAERKVSGTRQGVRDVLLAQHPTKSLPCAATQGQPHRSSDLTSTKSANIERGGRFGI